jgi:nitrogen-specific signal transduction histidine kinase
MYRNKAMNTLSNTDIMNQFPDLSSLLFSMTNEVERLSSILSDSIILNLDFELVAMGSEVEELTHFSNADLLDKSIRVICENEDLVSALKERLKSGYFRDMQATLVTKYGESISVLISGFYLGLISDINGHIVLRVRAVNVADTHKQTWVAKARELDSFIYRTAHDLRGPLATIKGLVNLLKIRKDDIEVDALTSMIDVHAHKLDDKLFKLLYMADQGEAQELPKGWLNMQHLEGALRKMLTDNCQTGNVRFTFNSPVSMVDGVNEAKTNQLLSSILLFIISLPLTSVGKEDELQITVDTQVTPSNLTIKYSAGGFIASDEVQHAIRNTESLYDDLLINPYLFNYYVAQKIALQLKAFLSIDFYGFDKQAIILQIPLKGPGARKQPVAGSAKINTRLTNDPDQLSARMIL